MSPSLAGDGVVFADDMHGRFLGRSSAAVDPHIVGAVIGGGICRVYAEGDEPTCAAAADLIVGGLAIAVGAVTDPSPSHRSATSGTPGPIGA